MKQVKNTTVKKHGVKVCRKLNTNLLSNSHLFIFRIYIHSKLNVN